MVEKEERGGKKASAWSAGVRTEGQSSPVRGRGRLSAVSARKAMEWGHAFFLLHARGRTAYT
jgi:hypothetical protein